MLNRLEIPATGLPLPNLMKELGLVESTTDGIRMIQQRAVRIDTERVEDSKLQLMPGNTLLIQVGKRRIARVKLVVQNRPGTDEERVQSLVQ